MKKILVIFAFLLVLPFVARADEINKEILPQGIVPGVQSPVILEKKTSIDDPAKKAAIVREQEKKKQVANPQNLQIFFPAENKSVVVK